MGSDIDESNENEDNATKAGISKVEKTLTDLELAQCNRKVARLQTAVNEYEQRNEELHKACDKLDKDRADIIEHLKRLLQSKNEENKKLNDNITCIKETRAIDKEKFNKKVAELEKNYTLMKSLMTAQNQLLSGKVNMLEEFRATRNKLMMKYEKQKQDVKEQEIKYKRIIYDTEKKHVINNDKLKKEMEARLLKLIKDFQEATEARIAASTHRVISENISMNNEHHKLLLNHNKLIEQNEKFKQRERAARMAQELAEEERDKAIHKNAIHIKVIDKLTSSYQSIKNENSFFVQKSLDHKELQAKLKNLNKKNDDLNFQIRVLEQNLHARSIDHNKLSMFVKENENLKNTINTVTIAVKAAIKLGEWAESDSGQTAMDRQTFLTELLKIITSQNKVDTLHSLDSLTSLGKVYQVGDLGFVTELSKKKSTLPIPSSKFIIVSRPSLVSERSSSAGSLKTVPSLKLIPSSKKDPVKSESIPSFATSPKSTMTPEEDEVDDQNVIFEDLQGYQNDFDIEL